jgi:hypothetical protein
VLGTDELQEEKEAEEMKKKEEEARNEFRRKLAEKEHELTMKVKIFGNKTNKIKVSRFPVIPPGRFATTYPSLRPHSPFFFLFALIPADPESRRNRVNKPRPPVQPTKKPEDPKSKATIEKKPPTKPTPVKKTTQQTPPKNSTSSTKKGQ